MIKTKKKKKNLLTPGVPSPGLLRSEKAQGNTSDVLSPRIWGWGAECGHPHKRILHEGGAVVEGVMQLNGFLGHLLLLEMASAVSMLGGRLRRSRTGGVST